MDNWAHGHLDIGLRVFGLAAMLRSEFGGRLAFTYADVGFNLDLYWYSGWQSLMSQQPLVCSL